MKRVVKQAEVIEAFRPANKLLDDAVDSARRLTTLERYKQLHPEIGREAGLKRLAGQARWLLIADGIAASIGSLAGFGVLSTEQQHNSGQYVFEFPGGIFTVRREPHDETDADDGKYFNEAFDGILEQAELADGIDGDAPLRVYLSVSQKAAVLKVCHPTLNGDVLKVPLTDLHVPAEPMPGLSPKPARSRARSSRVPARNADLPAADSSDPKP